MLYAIFPSCRFIRQLTDENYQNEFQNKNIRVLCLLKLFDTKINFFWGGIPLVFCGMYFGLLFVFISPTLLKCS